MSKYICPHCGESDYYELYSTMTAVAWTPHYINGVLQNNNPNHMTTVCRCAKCGEEFSAVAKHENIENYDL